MYRSPAVMADLDRERSQSRPAADAPLNSTYNGAAMMAFRGGDRARYFLPPGRV